MRRRIAPAVGAVALLAAIGAGNVLAADRDVDISGFRFTPRAITVNVGDTVTWTNRDEQAHSATSGTAWNTGDIAAGASASIRMDSAGTYGYICAIHPQMTGTVVVHAAGAPATDTALPAQKADPAILDALAVLGVACLAGGLLGARRFRGSTAHGPRPGSPPSVDLR